MCSYQYQNNILSVPANILYDILGLMPYNTYKTWCERGKLVRTKEGRGKGNTAWISYYDIAEQWIKDEVKKYLGDPKEVVSQNDLVKYIVRDFDVTTFFAQQTNIDCTPLSTKKQIELTHTAWVLNAVKTAFEQKAGILSKVNKKTVWQNVIEAIQDLENKKDEFQKPIWKFKLPSNQRSLERKYKRFLESGYTSLLHKNTGKTNASKITKEVGDFLLATYCLPNKLSIPEVQEQYDFKRVKNTTWKPLTTSAIYQFLYKPENERVWTLARDGKNTYKRKYKRTNTIEKSNWFPNCYWAFDGTKLDWIHIWDSTNKMGAKLKINVIFDVYSEKIIGYDTDFTESHVQQFKTIKKAVNEAECKPYFLTYDNQGGHKMNRMQTLYDSLVAEKGGAHYAGKAYEHGNPAEGLFKRLQQQVINKFWFSDGQSITVRKDDNKMNFDFIKENKHQLKTYEELIEAFDAVVNIWNNKKHPHSTQTRNEMYAHQMPMREELSILDIADKMWLEERNLKYHSAGLNIKIGNNKYQFEVYNENGDVDIDFRRKGVNENFIVRFDPENLDSFVQLYKKDIEGNVVFIANALPKRKTQPVPVLMKEGDKERWAKDNKVNELEYQRDLEEYKKLMMRTNITPEKLIEEQDFLLKVKGNMNKFQRSKIEAEENLTSATSRF